MDKVKKFRLTKEQEDDLEINYQAAMMPIDDYDEIMAERMKDP